ENQVELDPLVKDAWGIPVLRFDYRFGDNEMKMVADMAETAEEMLRAAGAEDIKVRREPLTEGWSIHELGTARMGTDPRTSVTNPFGQTHDVKNLFIADGSVFVSASCQNPTWTILALAWRSVDFLKEEMRRGNVLHSLGRTKSRVESRETRVESQKSRVKSRELRVTELSSHRIRCSRDANLAR